MSFIPELLKWYEVYFTSDRFSYVMHYKINNDRIFYLIIDTKYDTVEKSSERIRYLKSRENDFDPAKKKPNKFFREVVKVIFEEDDEI